METIPPIAPLPEPRNTAGAIRKVGVELEFGGLSPADAAEIVARVLGGEAERRDRFRYAVETGHGRFTIELDTRWAHPDFVESIAYDLPEDIRKDLAKDLSEAAGEILQPIFPTELICPPMPFTELGLLRPLGEALAAAGALGTAHSAFSGFGMHLNVEVARLEVAHLVNVLRAYVLLDFWLRRECRVALIRHLQRYIEPFPEAYKQRILAPDYAPDMAAFIDDHLRFNPTRNRELDLLPIFAVIDRERVEAALPDIKNSPRPTFHWRLPNCRIDEPGWAPALDWARWIAVETLASDPSRLAASAEEYLKSGPSSELEAKMRRFIDLMR